MKKIIPWIVFSLAFLLLAILILLICYLQLSLTYRCFMVGCLLLLAAIQTYEIRERITSGHGDRK